MPDPSRPRPRRPRPGRVRVRPSVERCEPRLLLAAYTVTTAADDGPGSLRAAIALVNADSTPDVIRFAVGGGGSQVIRLDSPLEPITNPVTLDGTSQPGYASKPLVAIDGAGAGSFFADGLTIQAAGTVVQGLAVINFGGNGIVINGVGGCVIRADYLGVDPLTLMPAPNQGDGVNLFGAPGNVIGQPGAGNVIGGNRGNGINALFGSTDESIQGNFIGISPARSGIGLGPVNLSNGADGIFLLQASGVTVGGTAAGAGNVISFNVANGVNIAGGSGNLLQGNLIGTDASGLTPRANGGDGVLVGNSPGNTIGGAVPAAANVISGNATNGVDVSQGQSAGNLIQGNNIGVGIDGRRPVGNASNGVRIASATGTRVLGNVVASNGLAGLLVSEGSSGSRIAGNLIGTDAAGDPLANLTDGVFLIQSPGNTVGGTSPAARNVISANQNNGVSIRGPLATGNLVQGNYLGTDPSGTLGLGNVTDGVFIQNAPGNTIGGSAPGAGNLISRNRIGVDIATSADADLGQSAGSFTGGRADGNVVQGNLIGLDATGVLNLGNLQSGVLVVGGSSNVIGGPAPAGRNVIANSLSDGVGVQAAPGVAPTTGNVIQGNLIGLDATGTRRAGNRQDGVHLVGAVDTLVGGPDPALGNVISGNTVGVEVSGAGAPAGTPLNAVILGNVVGLGADGLQLAPVVAGDPSLGNTGDGILVGQGARGVTIGGASAGSGNVLSGNGSSGVRFAGASGGNLVRGNLIGVGRDGQAVRGNGQSGVLVGEGSGGNTVGGTAPGSGNVIAGNSSGVTLTNNGTSGNLFQGNTVGLARDGSTPAGNLAYGFLLLGGASGNTIGGTSASARNVVSANGQGIAINGPGLSGNLIQGNFVGLDAAGATARPNARAGIAIGDSGGNTIGGTVPGAGNVISGNSGPGLILSGAASSGNLVAGNIVGLDAVGVRAVGNANYGIQVDNAPRTTIGGDRFTARNVVSGNGQAGIEINGINAFGSVISGNLIGTDATGRAPLGNLADGVLVQDAPGLVIGGASGLDGNLISGNLGNGVSIVGQGSVFDLVAGNLIGTDGTGGAVLSNLLSGVFVSGAPGVTIGGTAATLRNVISGNGQHGVRVAGSASATTEILGNLIGADASGRGALGNLVDGVFLDNCIVVAVGGTAPGSTNVISGNFGSGVELGGVGSFGNVVSGNLIGTDSTGRAAVPNAIGVFVNNANHNQVGGASPFSGNLISGNSGPGVEIAGQAATDNGVQGNRIGTDLLGLAALPNMAGVFIDGAPSNAIGGAAAGSGNLISGNLTSGVVVQGTNASGNLIQGNLIGTDASGGRALGSTPQQAGVLLTDAPGNVVGGSVRSAANVASGNVVGVVIAGFNAQGNLVIGNLVGTDIAGRSPVGNTVGVYINGASSNTIGGASAGFGNLISGNATTGITLYGPQTTRTQVLGNRIGTSLDGSAAVPNQEGVYIESSPSNTVGGPTPAGGNLISGNSVAGVYLFAGASGNLIRSNRIGFNAAGGPLGNAQYGILFYNAANNVNDRSKATGNAIGNSGIGDFREFTGPVTTSSAAAVAAVKARSAHPKGPRAKAAR